MRHQDSTYWGLKLWLAKHGCSRFKLVNHSLMCTCPFHEETNPSFGIVADTSGKLVFKCFACQVRGSLKHLVNHLEGSWVNPTFFKHEIGQGSPILDLDEFLKDKDKFHNHKENFPEEVLDKFNFLSPYWSKRGIQDSTVKFFKLGWDRSKFSVSIPMREVKSQMLAGVCFRYTDCLPDFPADLLPKIRKQRFYQLPGSSPNRSFFGQETICNFANPVYLFESALDAANYWQRTAYQSLARWGTNLLTKLQRDYLQQFSEILIVADNDEHGIGQQNAKALQSQLLQIVRCKILTVQNHKDYTEAIENGVENPILESI